MSILGLSSGWSNPQGAACALLGGVRAFSPTVAILENFATSDGSPSGGEFYVDSSRYLYRRSRRLRPGPRCRRSRRGVGAGECPQGMRLAISSRQGRQPAQWTELAGISEGLPRAYRGAHRRAGRARSCPSARSRAGPSPAPTPRPLLPPRRRRRLQTPAPTKPAAAAKPITDGQAAMRAREKQCGTEWKAQKAELHKTNPAMKWPQFWSDCNKRLKGQAQ